MTPDQLRRRISKLREHQPLTIRLERSLATADPLRRPPWYRSQKEHWLGWLREYDGPGYYGRRDWGRSSEFVWCLSSQCRSASCDRLNIDPHVRHVQFLS